MNEQQQTAEKNYRSEEDEQEERQIKEGMDTANLRTGCYNS